MGRRLLILASALALTACGDPLVIIGDAPGFMRIVAGKPDTTGTASDSIAARARLTRPVGLAISPKTGVLYFADQSSRLFSVTSAGHMVELHKSFFCFDKDCLNRPQGVALSNDELVLFIADDGADHIWKFTLANKDLSVFAGTGEAGVSADGTPALQAKISGPGQIVILPDNRLLFTERASGKVRVIGTDGILRTLASGFNQPVGLAYANGTLYVSEIGGHKVWTVDVATGNTTGVIAGTGVAGYSGDDGPAADARLNTPWALAATSDHLFIADQLNNRVRAVNLQTRMITTFAGTGATLFTGNGRSAAQTSVVSPSGLAVSSFGYLYISDWGHSVVWRTPIRINTQ